MQRINKRMASGIVWMVGARLLDRSIGIVSTLILARLLVPGDFGLVSMATAIGGILDLLGAFNFDLALIQKEKAEDRHYNTVWTFNFILGVACGVALIALAAPAAEFYREMRLTQVMYVLSISYFVSAFTNVGVVNFRKELDFKSEFVFIFLKRVVTFVVTIVAAYVLKSYWALLIGMTFGRVVGTILSYWMNAYRPSFSLSATSELFHFSKWMLINNILFFLLHDGCTFIIGRLFGVSALGVYSVAYEISSLPSTELVAPINRVTFPGFAKMISLNEKAQTYLKVLGMTALMILPVGMGIAAVAEPLVFVALGDKWLAAIPLIQLLALHGVISALRGNDGPIWMALGKPREITFLVLMFLAVLFPAIYYFVSKFGVAGVGYAYLVAHIPTHPYSMKTTKKLLGLRWSQMGNVLWRPVAAVSMMYLAVIYFDTVVAQRAAVLRLLFDALVGSVVYSVGIIFLWRISGRPEGAEMFCIEQLSKFKRKIGLAPRSDVA